MLIAIAQIILGGSILGIGAIALRKIPLLREIPEEEIEPFSWKAPFSKLGGWIKRLFGSFWSSFLHKLLSKIRVLTLRLEKRTGDQLQKLREKSKVELNKRNDYWEELKKAKEESSEQGLDE